MQIENARIAGYAIPIVVPTSAWFFLARIFRRGLHGFGAAMGIALIAALGVVIGAAVFSIVIGGS